MWNLAEQRSDFFRELAFMLDSGMPLADALRQASGCVKNRGFRLATERLAADVSAGRTLSEAMNAQPSYFENYEVSIVEAGEESGELRKVLVCLSDKVIKPTQLAAIRTIFFLPIATCVGSLCLLVFLHAFLVPLFRNLYDVVFGNEPLPALTELMLSISFHIRDHLSLFVLILLALAVCLIMLMADSPLLWFLALCPFSKTQIRCFWLSRACTMWSCLSKIGITTGRSLGILSEMIRESDLSQAFAHVQAMVLDGCPLADALDMEEAVSPQVSLQLRNTPHSQHVALRDLSAMFWKHNLASITWQRVCFTFITGTCLGTWIFTVLISLFLPFGHLFRFGGGGI